MHLQPALIAVWDIVARANHYLVEKEPWKLAKDDAKRDELAGVLYASAETLRILAVADRPDHAGGRRAPVGASSDPDGPLEASARARRGGVGRASSPGTQTTKRRVSLFPRLDADEAAPRAPIRAAPRLSTTAFTREGEASRNRVSREAPRIDRMWRPL